MPDIIDQAWTCVAECRLLAEEATDATARSFFAKLASNWERVALNYEVLAERDRYLVELRRLDGRDCRSEMA
jgi:hypothetical protein